MKIDLHCHSKWSKRPTLWIMQKLGCPESFTEPLELYRIAKEKGMGQVTITDHNVIDGALEIAHLSDAFVGCEYTTYFPDDNCKVHILVYGQTEAQHEDLTRARENIFDLVAYLRGAQLKNVRAHPLFWINDRLTMSHIEQLLLLFKNWEINGDMNCDLNRAVYALLRNIDKGDIERLANRHGIDPHYPEPWVKNLTAGSDDHSSLNLASACTRVRGAESLGEFWIGLETGHAEIECTDGTPLGFARNIYGIGYQFYKQRFSMERYTNKDLFLSFLEECLRTHSGAKSSSPAWYHLMRSKRRANKEHSFSSHSLFQIARVEAERKILSDPQLMAIVRGGRNGFTNLDEQWFEFVNQISNRVLGQFAHHVVDRVLKGQLVDLFHSAGSGAALYMLMAPYFVGFSHHRRQREWGASVLDHFNVEPQTADLMREPNVAHFTDTFYHENGVARSIQRQLALAQRLEKNYAVLTCRKKSDRIERGVHNFESVTSFAVPEYPGVEMLTPPFLQMLRHCYDAGYTHIHLATPGPVGLTGLAIARILGIPVSSTYHTSLPLYAKAMTEDSYVEDSLWKYMAWFYGQTDEVLVPSWSAATDLLEHGIGREHIKVHARGCDIERFHPDCAPDYLNKQFGIADDRVNFLYVGRIAKEKGLRTLQQAFIELSSQGVDARLIVAGEGPYAAEMQEALRGTVSLFPGYVPADELPGLYASCDGFVFPSTTDTIGNVVLEAQASGLPVIVTDRGGPRENILADETGLIVEANNSAALARVMRTLAVNKALRERMGAAARLYMQDKDFATCFEQIYGMYTGHAVDHPGGTRSSASATSPFPLDLRAYLGSNLSIAPVSADCAASAFSA